MKIYCGVFRRLSFVFKFRTKFDVLENRLEKENDELKEHITSINNKILEHDDLVKSVSMYKQLNTTQIVTIVKQDSTINSLRKTLKSKYDIIR